MVVFLIGYALLVSVDEWSLGKKEILTHSPNKEKERNDRPLSKKDINKNVIQNRYQRC